MPAISLRGITGAPTPGGQNWVNFWKNQFAGMPKYPLGSHPMSHWLGGNRVGGTPVTGGTDTGVVHTPVAPAAGTGVGVGPSQIRYYPGGGTVRTLHPVGTVSTPGSVVPGSGGAVPPPVVQPTPITGGLPYTLGPPDWGRYLLGFMSGYSSV